MINQRRFKSSFKLLKSLKRQELLETQPSTEQFVNHIMKDGLKQRAKRIIQDSLDYLKINSKELLLDQIHLSGGTFGTTGAAATSTTTATATSTTTAKTTTTSTATAKTTTNTTTAAAASTATAKTTSATTSTADGKSTNRVIPVTVDSRELFEMAIDKVSPLVRVKTTKMNGKNQLVPRPLTTRQSRRMGISWISEQAMKRRGELTYGERIGNEMILILKGESGLFQKRENVHKQALANRSNLVLTDRKL